MPKKNRTVGDIFLELEVLLDELIDRHQFQWGDIIWWVYGHLHIHRPDAREDYASGGHPELRYGPKKSK
jgi:hypothetical protein